MRNIKRDKAWFEPSQHTLNPPAEGPLVEFEYVNWRGNQYTYVVDVEAISIAGQDPGGYSSDPADQQFILHGDVVTRDGDTRPEMGTRRRSFMIQKIVGAVRVLEKSK